jgi:hypothetical protein
MTKFVLHCDFLIAVMRIARRPFANAKSVRARHARVCDSMRRRASTRRASSHRVRLMRMGAIASENRRATTVMCGFFADFCGFQRCLGDLPRGLRQSARVMHAARVEHRARRRHAVVACKLTARRRSVRARDRDGSRVENRAGAVDVGAGAEMRLSVTRRG